MASSLEEVAFYTKTIEDSFKLLGSSYQGLSTAQAQSLAEQYGRNEIPQGKRMTFLEKLVNELNYALIYVLIAGAIISFAFDHIADAVVIICVIIINVIVSVYMERRAESTNEKLRAMMSPSALALRDGQRSILPSAELIPGDIVYLQAGDIVPADGRVIVAYDLYVQEAALTGESYAINKSTTPIASLVSTQLPIAERTCMVFSGTQVLKGSGQVLITAIGKNSEIGKINYMLLQMGWQKTPLQLQLQVFGHVLSVIIVVLAAFALGVALGRKHSVKDSFAYAVAVAVAAVPESLPSVVTITFAIGVRLMARKGAIIKALPAVETLGSVSVICSDKTGTLTQNVLTLKTIGTKHGLIELSDEGRILSTSNHGSAKAPDRPIVEADIFRFILPGLLCNDAVIRFGDESNKSGRKSQFNGQPAPLPISPDQFAIQGEPTETCIMTLATKVISLTTNDPTMSARIVSDTCRHYRRLAEIPFDSTSKYMASLHELTKEDCKRWLGASSATLADSTKVIFLKGAPERLISLTSDRHSFWLGNADALAARGMRVLGLAYRILPSSAPSFATNSLTDDDIFTERGGDYKMVSLLGILDPPRPEAITAVRHAQKAGITVKMITGDHPATALTIAKQVGIQMNPGFAPTPDDADMKLKAITGLELDEEWETSIDAFDTMVMSNHIFARTSPEHKLKIVQSLQRQHIICSMTGDGVNDAPALKAANVGVAMGIAGSGVAKEAAEMVITNDNFATIVDAVRIGRCTHQNLVKVLNFVLPTNGGQAFSIIFALIIGVDVPITALQVRLLYLSLFSVHICFVNEYY